MAALVSRSRHGAIALPKATLGRLHNALCLRNVPKARPYMAAEAEAEGG